MSESLFLSTVQRITSGPTDLGELVSAAGQLTAMGDVAGAEQLYRVWISCNPDNPGRFVAWFNLSTLPLGPDRVAAVTEALEKALELKPDFWPAYINLGGQRERAGDADGAVALWRQAVDKLDQITGQNLNYKLTALKQISRVLMDHQQQATAEVFLRQCLDLDPKARDAAEQYIGVRLAQCEWPVVQPWEGVDRKALMLGFSPLSMGVFTDDPLLQLATAARYSEAAIDPGPYDPTLDRRDATIDLKGRRLRIGYVSSDLRDHAIGYLMAEMFELHDREQVEVFTYYCGPKASGPTWDRIRSAVEHPRDISELDDTAAARLIAEDGIDILVDINGHTRFARSAVFARRPAPVIVNWLGYPGTMGTPYHNYIVADAEIIPEGSELYYAEQVVRLPCYQPNDRKRVIAPHRPSRAEAGLPGDAFVFCCFNGSQKIGRFTFLRWVEILKRTENSVLWLLDSDEATNARLLDFAEANGLERSRIVFAQKLANPFHLARYPLADLFLDTAPYGAHTTASDALFMGVPMLTLEGRAFASRVCASLVRAAGLPELVMKTPEAYVETAVSLASDPAQISVYKAKLEANRASCTLFDMEKLTSSLEALYRQMAETHQRGQTPQPDLDSLDAYLKAGIAEDIEAMEMLTVTDYHGLYRERLAALHRHKPIREDRRLWTAEAIAAAEGKPAKSIRKAS
ncbi:MAG: N-acetylglucosamine transferase [Proteobacteria bacterium]|nr:N-acetylglucosamine transferase [Pseudomonadota bacterium]